MHHPDRHQFTLLSQCWLPAFEGGGWGVESHDVKAHSSFLLLSLFFCIYVETSHSKLPSTISHRLEFIFAYIYRFQDQLMTIYCVKCQPVSLALL